MAAAVKGALTSQTRRAPLKLAGDKKSLAGMYIVEVELFLQD
jgi:hypothetical protein